ncbi:extracellular solute-binding protein [Paenibacillus sp.]|uniref:extracellular solute-binding protein n=1 Tax=Paenibacillus sp. TaxID=58172 RepID=UPI002D2749A9|nr:extracellular solute-binding protein [Paenibacillus sp.]HZG57926.1 extracellular solute-binding protein [Paenibacillus sp.]
MNNGTLPRKTAAITIAALMLVLAACSGAGTTEAPAPAPETSDSATSTPTAEAPKEAETPWKEPYVLSIMVDNFTPDIPPADSPSMKFIEAQTKTDLDVTWVPSANYTEKLNATMASGDMPKVMVTLGAKVPSVINAIRTDVFWKLDDYLKDYPRLSAMNEVTRNNISVDGGLYGIPRHLDLAVQAVNYRKDWQEKLGLPVPKTLDDIYNMAKAFTEQDPDGNGKHDTYGVLESNLISFNQILIHYGGPHGWTVQDGKFIPAHESPEYLQALNFYKRLYDEKLMNQDFAAITDVQAKQLYETHKGGMRLYNVWELTERTPVLQSTVPDAELAIANIVSPNGEERYWPGSGYSGVYLIPKSSVKTEQELRRVLQYFEDLASPEVQLFMQYGLEGVHFKFENGKPKKIDEALYQKEVNILRRLKPHTMSDVPEGDNAPAVNAVNKHFVEKESLTIANPANAFISDTYTEIGPELDKILHDARVKYVMGAIDEAGLQAAADEWRKQGGDKIIQEYEKQYADAK